MARAEHDMFSQHHGTCAICLQMVSVTLRAGRRHANGVARHLFCDECMAPHACCDDDPDVARLVAAYRDRRCGADDG